MFLLAAAGSTQAGTITVGPAGAIQAGIDAANDGDTVLVAPGDYVITESISFRGKAITVVSEAGPDQTTIRMGTPTDPKRASVVIFENNETEASVLEGFTITGGKGSSWISVNYLCGGGILFNSSSGTVRNCVIVQNRVVDSGGGVFCIYPCSPILIDCFIAENSAGVSGGGVFPWSGASLTLTNCIVRGNSSLRSTQAGGGGACCGQDSFLTMTDCVVEKNSAAYIGGGVHCVYSSIATLTNCTIADNSALWTGGVAGSFGSSLTVRHCAITGNTAQKWGGGINCLAASAAVTNCTIAQNTAGTGGGIVCQAQSYGPCSVTVTNSILWGNMAPTGSEIIVRDTGAVLTIAYTNVAGGKAGIPVYGTLNWGEGNIDVDPCFACIGYWDDNGTRDSSDDVWVASDYHLKSEAGRWDPIGESWVVDDVTSPCIDGGDPMSPIGRESFPNGGFVNMGAYGGTSEASKTYFGEPACETIVAGDINGDGQVNRTDLEIMALHWTDDEPLPLP